MSLTFNDCLSNDLATTFLNVNEFAGFVTVTRGGNSTPEVAAIVAARSYEVIEDGSAATSVQAWDFDIIAAAYLISAVQVDPRTGDRITDASSNVFEVLPIPGRQCFEPTGGDGLMIRIHTKRVS